jgi:16S rRNA (adenine1518-N6/adenine1519-N6)-dimethyltransferase
MMSYSINMRIKAKKSLGQNFLINTGILDKIVISADIAKTDTVVEVGPGTGLLTEKLAAKAKNVIAVEKDHRLILDLSQKFKNTDVQIVQADILRWDAGNLPQDYKIVANIPYYITSHFLRTIFEKWPKPKLIVLTIQKEVAQRILAKPPHMNLLALSIQLYAEPEIISYVSKGSFRPTPKVDSAVIRLIPRATKVDAGLMDFLKIGFGQKRKKLLGLLAQNSKIESSKLKDIFKQLNIAQDARAENLTITEWQELKQNLPKVSGPVL